VYLLNYKKQGGFIMKSRSTIFIGMFVAATLLLLSSMLTKNNLVEADTITKPASESRTITSSGKGAIQATPDVAYVNMGVITDGQELSKVQAENAEKMAKVMASLSELGIKKDEMKTISYNVNPNYKWDEKTGKSFIVGYTVSNTLVVTINDISQTGNLLDKVVASGSNSINSIRFGIKNEAELYNQALELAVKDAKAKAAAMGKGLGIENIQPLKITESSNRYTPIYNERSIPAMDSAKAATPISGGELEVSATVSIEFLFY
jgi:uncharacterized protein